MRRRLIIAAILAAVLIGLGIGIVLLVDRTPALQNSLTPNSNLTNPSLNVNNLPLNRNSNTNTNPDTAIIQYVSRNFSELYGSGTTQNDSANVIESKQWGTVNFNLYLDTLVAQERAKEPNPKFIRTVSSALVIKVKKQTANTAAVTVTLQRVENGDTGDKQYYQDIILDLVKVGKDWKVNAATWQPPV